MTGYTSVLKTGRWNSELSIFMRPKYPDPNKRAIIYAHGANGNGSQIGDWKTQSNLTKFYAKFAQAGFVILSADWGGPHTYGNDAELASMEAGWAWLKATGYCKTDKVILSGGSMGMLSTSRFAAEHPSWVAGLNCWIPAIDIEDLRTADALGLRDSINTAWGLPLGSYTALDGSVIPTRGRPLDRLADVSGITTHLWYSAADTVTKPGAVDVYAAGRPNVIKHQTSTTLDHSDASIGTSDPNAILSFFNSVA